MRAPRVAVALLLLACAWAGTGCSRPPAPTPQAPGTTPSGTATPSAPASSPPSQSAEPAGPVALAKLRITLSRVARGFEQPLFVTHAGDGSGRLFVVEQTGRVRVVRRGRVADAPFLDVSRRISTGGERGLLGLAFAPDYKTSGRFYVNFTDANGDTTVARYTADDPASDTPKLSGPTVVLKVRQPHANHNGGCIVFGPDDNLWIGMGDGGSAGDPQARAQNKKVLLGKMLRLDVSGSGAAPAMPPGNPNEAGDASFAPQVVQYGLRNPWRFSFDRKTADLWIGDVGQNAWEEIDVVPIKESMGVNWGWNRFEGTHPYPPGASRTPGSERMPVIEYSHTQGESVTGGYVYRGTRYPALDGVYLYGDFVDGWIAGARLGADGTIAEKRVLVDRPGITPSSFGEGEDGTVYLCDYGGTLYRIEGR